MGSDGVLAMTMVVRDEEDILAANLEYHLSQGVDVVLVVDHGSTDGTSDILTEYARSGRVRSVRDERRPHVQSQRVNRLLGMATEEYHADWIIHCDADEFWMPAAGSLRDVFAAVPERFGYLRVRRHSFLPAAGADPFHQRMIIRRRRSLNLRGLPLEPKVAQRPGASRGVTPGNHDLANPTMEMAPDFGPVEVLHFQMRSYDQFERKVQRNGIGHECNTDRIDGIGCDQLELLAMHRRGELKAYYDAEALDPARIGRGLVCGELLIDRRLQTRLSGPVARAEESPEIQELLRRCWEWGAEVADARQQSEERVTSLQAELSRVALDHAGVVTQLEDELQLARRGTAEIEHTLDVVRRSRVMRYTAPARRAYYRLRPLP